MPLPQALAPAWSGLRTSPPEVKTAYRHPGGFGCWSNCLARSLLVFVVVDLFAVLVQLLIEVGLLLLRQMAAVGRHVFLLFLRIGENTQGVFSDVLGRNLPNGCQFGLPTRFLARSKAQPSMVRGFRPTSSCPCSPTMTSLREKIRPWQRRWRHSNGKSDTSQRRIAYVTRYRDHIAPVDVTRRYHSLT